MKKKIFKDYQLNILLLLLVLIVTILSVFCQINDRNARLIVNEKIYNINCKTSEERKSEACKVNKPQNQKQSFFSMLTSVLNFYFFPRGLEIVVIVIIPACYITTRYLRNKIIFTTLPREGFKKTKRKIFARAYCSILSIMLPLALSIILCLFFSDSLKPFDREFLTGAFGWNANTLANPTIFIIIYFFVNLFFCLTYVNISLIISRKYHNFFVAVLLSFITIVGVELFLELIVGTVIFGVIIKTDVGVSFNIINGIVLNDALNIYGIFAFAGIVFALSLCIAKREYYHKEDLIIDCEKNE